MQRPALTARGVLDAQSRGPGHEERVVNVSKSILVLALACASGAALAAEAESMVPEPSIFVERATMASMTELEAAKAALARSQDPGIRTFAERMMKDHTASQAELASLARGKGIATPTRLDAEHQAALSAITSKTGTDFDRAFSEHMNMDHTKAIALFEAATKSPDPELAGFAKKTLPTLKEHKKLAEKLPGKPSSATSPGGR
jgi:putative membrane protein